jgi:transcriptional regulator
MYLPQQFAETRLEVLHALIRSRPLGTWVATSGGELIANHMPFLLDETRGPHGTLCCHVARPNPVAAHAGSALASVVCFNGSQTYVTPSWYPSKQAHGKAVPTWNYAVVHAHGQASFIDDRDWLLQHVGAITASQEAKREQPWQVSDAPASYIEQMVRGIVGVEIRIDRIEGKWKVSQNQPEANRRGVVDGLQRQGDAESIAMAELVKQHLSDDTG